MAAEYTTPSALSHFDPTELLDALSTGIIVLDAQLCAIYANVAAQDPWDDSSVTPEITDTNGIERFDRASEPGET